MPSLDEIQQALQRCMAAEPPIDFGLSADASQLTTVFAEMRFAREHVRERDSLKPKQVAAFDRWSASAPGVTSTSPAPGTGDAGATL